VQAAEAFCVGAYTPRNSLIMALELMRSLMHSDVDERQNGVTMHAMN